MAGEQQYDLSQVAKDPGWLNASVQDKIAFLSAHDADFAKASPADKAGYINHLMGNDRMTEFEKARTPEGSALWRGTKAAAGALKGLAAGAADMFEAGLTPGQAPGRIATQAAQAALDDARRKQEGRSGGYRLAAGVGSIAGVNATGMEEAADRGDAASIVGQALPPAALALTGIKAVRETAGKGMRAAAKAVEPATNIIREKIPNRLMNSVVRTHAGDFNFGKNPGETLVKAGITGLTEEGLMKGIQREQNHAAMRTDTHLSQPAAQTPIDITPAVDTVIDAAKAKAATMGDSALAGRLDDLRDGLLTKNAQGSPVLKPKEIAQLRRTVGESIKWTTDPVEASMKDVKQDIYRALNDTIDAAVPGAKKLTQFEAGLITAKKSLQKAIDTKQGQNIGGIMDVGAAGIGTALGIPGGPGGMTAGAAAGVAARRALGSTAVKTNMAKFLGRQGTPQPQFHPAPLGAAAAPLARPSTPAVAAPSNLAALQEIAQPSSAPVSVQSLTRPKAAPAAPTKPVARSTPRSESLATYNSLPEEIRQAVDAQVTGLQHMPQALREGREQQLQQFGGKGTMLKERLAREAARDEGLPVLGEGVAKRASDLKAELQFLEKRSRELNDKMGRMKTSNWPGRNNLIKQMKAISEKVEKLKAQLPTSE